MFSKFNRRMLKGDFKLGRMFLRHNPPVKCGSEEEHQPELTSKQNVNFVCILRLFNL